MERRKFLQTAAGAVACTRFAFGQLRENGGAVPVRSIMKQFTSELLDKPWFYDREQWQHYLDLLASARFNRFHLAFGLGYDMLNRVDDSYFLFLYPFLLAVPGYDVHATNLADAERDRNLETLQFIGEQSVEHGIDFELGIWMHGYQWPSGFGAKNQIEGLTQENHAAYCRDALTILLQKCPAISSVALRIHGESGVAEGSYDFWTTVFDGVKRSGRKVEIDLHAKGIDEQMIERALATGMSVNLSPKYSAEHFGMPYHQAAIREIEMPVAGHTGSGLMTLSEGSRVFTRYGYADLLREDRKYTVRHRVFSGTQRILLWDDPVWAAAYARAFTFCGSTGADLMEPLTCRGRRGSALPGRRDGYVDAGLETRWDWEKYTDWYRVWGQAMFHPQAAPAGPPTALAAASRILPIVTTAYLPSAACDAYWPEIYWNQPLAGVPKANPYGDTLAPKVFQNASPLDPQLFSTMTEFAHELLGGERSGKYSPVEVALWLEEYAGRVITGLRGAAKTRESIDAQIQAALGWFFAAKFRVGVLYALFETTADRAALEAALLLYRMARARWAEAAAAAKGIYANDLSVSDRFDERGQWADRLGGIDQDIADLEKRLEGSSNGHATAAIVAVRNAARRNPPPSRHTPPVGFRRKEPLVLRIAAPHAQSVRLYYRHVNQAERYQSAPMDLHVSGYSAVIPASYLDSPYPLQYYFELRASPKDAWLYPGVGPDLPGQPYFVVRLGGTTSPA